MSKSFPLLPVALAVAACATDFPEHREPVVRDSSGIRIVENTSPQWLEGQQWRLTEEPIVDIGGGDTAEEQLYRVRGAARLSDGRIVVADGGSQELRFYAPSGEHERSAGGRGGGPGEFGLVSLVAAGPGDTIWTADLRLNRVSMFGGTGEFIRSANLESFEGRKPSPPTGVFADGSLFAVVALPPPPDPKPDPVQVLADYVRYDPTGLPLGSVARAPLSDHFVQAVSPRYGGVAYWGLAFGRTTTTRVYGDRVFLGEGTTYEIRVLDTAGGVREVIRVARDPLPVTEGDIQAYREAQVAAAGDDNARRAMERLNAEMPFPTHKPAYADFLVDAGGGLWVEEYNRPGDEIPRWSVLQRDGVWMGTLVFPLRFEPLDIGDDYVLGLWRDADDVEHVLMYELVKP